MGTVARLNNEGDLLLSGEVKERLPVVTSGLIAHYPLDGTTERYVPSRIRYIRDYLNGSTSNTSNHWVEIQAIDDSGTNVALNKSGTSSIGTWNALLTNNVTTYDPYWGVGSGTMEWVQVDLGQAYTLSQIKVWHYWADGRQYWTKLEVSEDGLSWHEIFNCDIEGKYAEGASGKTHDLSNLGATIKPIAEENIGDFQGGLSVSKTATNLLTPITANFGVFSGMTGGKSENYTTKNGRNGVYLELQPSAGGVQFWNAGGQRDVTASTVYTVSATIKYDVTPHVNLLYLRQYRADGTQISEGGLYSNQFEIDLGDGWKRAFRTFTTHAECVKLQIHGYEYSAKKRIFIEDVQLEKSAYPTTYVDGSRSGTKLTYTLDDSQALASYTVHFEHRHPDLSTNINPTVFLTSYNGTNSNEWVGMVQQGNVMNPMMKLSPVGVWNRMTITWNGTSAVYYMNGVNVHTQSAKPLFNVSDKLSFSSRYGWNTENYLSSHEMRNVSVYNRVLSASEIALLNGKTTNVNMNSNGDLKSKVEEDNYKLPVTSRVIPLGDSGDEKNLFVKPTNDTLAYDNGNGAFVGTAGENLYVGEAVIAGSTVVTEDGWDKVTFTTAGNYGRRYYVPLSKLVNGQTYTVSATVYNPMNKTVAVHLDLCDLNEVDVTLQPYETRVLTTTASRATYDNTYRFSDLSPTTVNDTIWIKDFQFENRAYRTPYMGLGGTRPYTRLNYVTTDLIPNYKDFSMVMWIKYQDLSTWQISGDWGTFYFGANGSSYLAFSWMENSVNTGNVNQQRSLGTGSSYTIPKNKWILLGLSVKENSEISIYANGVRYANFTSSFYLTEALKNTFELNSIDATSTGYPLNAYVKDLIFTPRALTYDEMLALHKTKMSNNGTLQLQGQIKEGVML